MNKSVLIFLFIIGAYNSSTSQGLYLPKGESGAMLNFYYGKADIGYLYNTFFGYSFGGTISTGIAFQEATYGPSGVDWQYFSIPIAYHLIKPADEGDWTLDLLGSYSFGNFTNPDYDTGDWERIGHELEIGARIGSKLIDSEQFVAIPKITIEHFWFFLQFDDQLHNYTEEYRDEGNRFTGSFDMLFAMEEDRSILISPFIRYNRDTFIFGGEVGFLWGKIY